MEEDILNNYLLWMMNKIFTDESLLSSYHLLCCKLNDIKFVCSIDKDENREQDAIDLRYLFGVENNINNAQICKELDIQRPTPSLFEVIVALIIRVQNNILDDIDDINLSNQEIFVDILESLELDGLKNVEYFDMDTENYIYYVVNRLFNHDYEYNGHGGLFTVSNPQNDMRNTEIWYQCMWYINEKLGGKYL